MSNSTAPRHVTGIEQTNGTHEPTGLLMVSRLTITTSFSDLCQEGWDSLSADDQAWWSDVVEAYHEARVELESLGIERREAARAIVDETHCDAPEDCAGVIRRAIEEARAEIEG